jgi:hypothetical protein
MAGAQPVEGWWGGMNFRLSTPAAAQCCITVPEHAPPPSWTTAGAVTPDGKARPLVCAGIVSVAL